MARGRKPSVEIGDFFITNEGCRVQVVNYKNKRCITVRFDDGYEKRTEAGQLKNGTIKNPFLPNVAGVGYTGDGSHKTYSRGKKTRPYSIWQRMLLRCYDENDIEKNPSYRGCIVCETWHNFQNFAEWYYQQSNSNKIGFQLDKDLLKVGSRMYSPETCSFVPKDINVLLTDHRSARGLWPQGVHYYETNKKYVAQLNCGKGVRKNLGSYETPEEAFAVYKREKEKFIKEQADKYKDVLHPKVYENLMNWEIN